MKCSKEEKEKALEYLRDYCKPGTTVYTVLRHVSDSGMTRDISLHVITQDNGKPGIYDISYLVARAEGYSRNRDNGGVRVSGCGMDMGFHLVMNLSYCLHGMQPHGDKAVEAHKEGRHLNPTPDNYRPGYSLNHQWL